MGNPLVSSQFVRLLDDRLRKVYVDTHKEIPSMVDRLYGVTQSDKAWEEFYGVGAVPDIPVFTGRLEYLGVAPEYYTRIEPKEFAGAITIERKLIDDDRYSVIMGRQQGLVDSYHRIKEKYGAQGFAYAFSAAMTFMQNEEGVALCSSSHTTKAGGSTTSGFSNAGSSALSKTSLIATRIAMRQFRNDIGARIEIEPDTIIVPDSLYATACEALGYDADTGASSDRDPDTAHYGKINAQYKRYTIIPYLRLDDFDTNNWYMVDSKRMKEFMLWIERIAPDIETERDFDTKMFKQSIYGRFGYGWTGWRWLYGHNVS
jgi:phage major head subunit gpT-like protein